MQVFKKIHPLFIAFAVAVLAILPKSLKQPQLGFVMLGAYFAYTWLVSLLLFWLNHRILSLNRPRYIFIKFLLAYLVGFVLLLVLHSLLWLAGGPWLGAFLNLGEATFVQMVAITLFRVFLFHFVAFFTLLSGVFADKYLGLPLLSENTHTNGPLPAYKNTVLTRFQDKLLPLDVNEIAFFYLSEGIVCQYMFSGGQYVQNTSLDSMENELGPQLFFRANRQFLVHRKAVIKAEHIEARKLKLTLCLPAPEEIVVSKAKSAQFLKWLAAA